MKHPGHLATLLIFSPLIFTSCNSVHYTDFYVAAITTQEKEIPCVIVIEDQVHLNKENNEPVLTPAKVQIPFRERSDGTGFENVKLGVKSVELDAGRKIIHGLRDEDVPPYFEEWRTVQSNDAARQLFILRRNPNYQGPANP